MDNVEPLAENIFSLQLISAEFVLLLSIAILASVRFFTSERTHKSIGTGVAVAAKLIAILFIVFFVERGRTPLFVVDDFAVYSKILVLFSGIIALILAHAAAKHTVKAGDEHPLMIVLICLGAMLALSAGDLLVFLSGLEICTIALFLTIHIDNERKGLRHATQSLLFANCIASAFVVFGVLWITTWVGSSEMGLIFEASQSPDLHSFVFVGLFAMLLGQWIKLSAVPFHIGFIRLHAAQPYSLGVVTQSLVFVAYSTIFARLLMGAFQPLLADWRPVVVLVASFSALVGALELLRARRIKVHLAWLSTVQLSFFLLGLAAGSQLGVAAICLSAVIYVITVALLIACFMALKSRQGETLKIEQLDGLGEVRPLLSVVLSIAVLSAVGLPPLAGFWAKLYVISAAMETGQIWLQLAALLLMFSSVIVAFVGVRMLSHIWFLSPKSRRHFVPLNGELRLVIRLGALLLVLYPLWGVLLESLADKAASSFF